MVLVRIGTEKPRWGSVCELGTISKLLNSLSDVNVIHVLVTIYRGVAYVMIRTALMDKTDYYCVPQVTWRDVHHIIDTDPRHCTCWRCEWRNKRKKYSIPDQFEHVYRSSDR